MAHNISRMASSQICRSPFKKKHQFPLMPSKSYPDVHPSGDLVLLQREEYPSSMCCIPADQKVRVLSHISEPFPPEVSLQPTRL
jgi:hypothetical protein